MASCLDYAPNHFCCASSHRSGTLAHEKNRYHFDGTDGGDMCSSFLDRWLVVYMATFALVPIAESSCGHAAQEKRERTVRLFIGIDISKTDAQLYSTQRFISDQLSPIIKPYGGLFNPDQLHMTLLFLGAVKESEIENVKTTLQQVVKKFVADHGTHALHGLSAKPEAWLLTRNKGRSSLVIMDLDVPPLMQSLVDVIKKGMQAHGFAQKKDLFRPHVTMGYIRNIDFKKEEPLYKLVIDFLKTVKPPMDPSSCTRKQFSVNTIILFRSLGSQKYEVLGSFDL